MNKNSGNNREESMRIDTRRFDKKTYPREEWMTVIPDPFKTVPSTSLLVDLDKDTQMKRESMGAKVARNMAFLAQLEIAVHEQSKRDLQDWGAFRKAYWDALRPEIREKLTLEGVSPEIPDDPVARVLPSKAMDASEKWWMESVFVPRMNQSGRVPLVDTPEMTEEEKKKLAEDIIKGFER